MFRPYHRTCASGVLPSLFLLVATAMPAPAAEPVAPPVPAEQPRKVITLCGNRMELMTGDEVKAMGFPWVDVPDDQNAATYYNQGANALHEFEKAHDQKLNELLDQQRDHVFDFGWDDSMKELAAYLDAAKPALDSYRKGSTMKLCQPPYQKTAMVVQMLLPDLAKAREACRLLAGEARRLEAQGKFKDAADNYLTIVRIGEHYGAGRCLIDHLVGIACIQIGISNAFKGITSRDYPPAELKRFLDQLSSLRDGLPDPAHAIRAEKAYGLQSVEDAMRLGPTGFSQMLTLHAGPPTPASPLEVRLFRIAFPDRTMKKDLAQFYDRVVAAAAKPYYNPQGRWSDYEQMAKLKPYNKVADLLIPGFGRARATADSCRATVEMLRISLALKMYQREHKAYPDALEKLVAAGLLKELPADPFSGKSFLYKTDKGEFVLYSVSQDMKDNGGNIMGQVSFSPDLADFGLSSKRPPAKKYERPSPPPAKEEPHQPEGF